MGNEAWSKIRLHGNLELKIWWQHILWILRINLEYFPKSILGIPYIGSKLKKSGVQLFKLCTNWSWNEDVMVIWRQLRKSEGSFQIQLVNSKSKLWIWNPIPNDPNFEFTHCHFDVLPPLPQKLHLGHSIHPKWAPYD